MLHQLGVKLVKTEVGQWGDCDVMARQACIMHFQINKKRFNVNNSAITMLNVTSYISV